MPRLIGQAGQNKEYRLGKRPRLVRLNIVIDMSHIAILRTFRHGVKENDAARRSVFR